MRRISDDERRARLGRRHHLAQKDKVTDLVGLAGDLVGLHGTDPATVFLAAAARSRKPEAVVAAMERALYDDRRLVRTLGMRRTMFVVPLELVPAIQAACTDPLVAPQRRRLVKLVEDQGIADDGAQWVKRVEADTLAQVAARGEVTGAELSKAIPDLRRQFSFGEGRKWAGTSGLTSRVLFLLSTEQRVVRGRPKGSWTSSQYRWSLMETWLPDGVPAMEAGAARTELVRRWLKTYGPATTNDVKWWTGWSLGQTGSALASANAVEVEMDNGIGWVLPDDDRPARAPAPWVALLPALDPTTMGWSERSWYLGRHGKELFDRSGNAGPTVWVDGRIVGGWAQQPAGEVVYSILEDIGSEAAAAVEQAAGDLTGWLGPVRVTPRFSSPLQRRLT
jgi:hypothetical protein